MTVTSIPIMSCNDKWTIDPTLKVRESRDKRIEKGSLYLQANQKTYAIARIRFMFNPQYEKARKEENKRREDLLERIAWILTTFPNSDYFVKCYAVERVGDRIEAISYEQGLCDLMDICIADQNDKNPVRDTLFTTKEKCGFGHSMAMAIQYLHDKGKVYQDGKPENYIYLSSGKVKLIDFEHMRDIEGDESRLVLLTPPYAAPEEIRLVVDDFSSLPATYPPKAKDLWHLGVALRILFRRESNSVPRWFSELLATIPHYSTVYSYMKEDKYSSQHPWFGCLLQFDPRDRRPASEVAQRLAIEAGINHNN